MAKGISNTSRTLEYLRREGYEADIVERFLAFAGKFGTRKDLFGIIDIIALGENKTYGVQSCGAAFSEHDKTILENSMSVKWLQCGNALWLIGWTKKKRKLDKGWSKAEYWTPRIKHYTLEDFGG